MHRPGTEPAAAACRRAACLLACGALLAAGAVCRRQPAQAPLNLEASRAATSLQRVTTDPSDETHPALSPDGAVLLYASSAYDAGAGRSLVLGLDPRGPHPAPVHGLPTQREAADPAWAPDGASYAFVLQERSGPRLMRAAPGGPQTPPAVIALLKAEQAGSPSWSPDGRQIALSVVEQGRHKLVIAAVDGSGVRVLGEGDSPAWSPDGRRMVFGRSHGTRHYLFVANADTFSPVVQLTTGEFDDFDPAWSPDARFIVMSSTRSPDQQTEAEGRNLFVINADGTGARQLTTGSSRAITPCWGRDGWVYFASDPLGDYDIWRVRPIGRYSELTPAASPEREETPADAGASIDAADASGDAADGG